MAAPRIFAASILVSALVPVTSARAEPATNAAPASGPRLEWRAPLQCPTRDEVLAQVAALAESERLHWDRFDVIRAGIERKEASWSLALEFVAPGSVHRRLFSSKRCADLAQAAAVAIVLAHRSDESEADDAAGASAPSEPIAAAPPAADTTAADTTAANTAANAAAANTAAPGGATAPEAPAADAGEYLHASSRGSATDVTLAASAEAALDPTTLGTPAFGAVVGVELGLGRIATGLYGAGFPAATTRLALGQSIALGLWTGGLRGCYRWGRGMETCALMELGELTAEGVGLIGARQSHDRWATPGLSASFTSTPFDGFGITTQLSAFHPLERGRYRVNESDVVHRLPTVGFRASLGFNLRLL
jgi:hypothetical protein